MSRRQGLVIVGVVVAILVVGTAIVVGSGAWHQLSSAFGGDTPIEALAVGECFDGGRAAADREFIVTVTRIDCGQSHDSELAGRIVWQGSEGPLEYPGEEPLVSFADSGCRGEFEAYVGIDFEVSALEMTYTYPLGRAWVTGSRSFECVVHGPPGEKLTGSVRGTRR